MTRPQAEESVGAVLAATKRVQAANPSVYVGEFGGASANKALSKAFEDDFKKAETLSLPITLIILVLAFGALVAAGVPLLLGLTAVMATLGLVALPSQIVPLGENTASIVLLVGLAVGVDYTLFYLRREREERARGVGSPRRDPHRRRDLRPRRADLRPDRDGRHGRHVPGRRLDVHGARRRRDHGRGSWP